MATTPAHVIRWVTPAPLWAKGKLPAATRMAQPALLGFASDAFMQQVTALLTSDHPQDLASTIARWESNRAPPIGAGAGWQPAQGSDPLKLYQPTHGRFYLVSASLVCQLPGLPDHGVDSTHDEKVSFVLRRLDGDNELAWVADATGVKSWRPLTTPQQGAVAAGEDVLPMFPLFYPDSGRNRRVHAGLIPTSSRENYQTAKVALTVAEAGDQRLAQFDARVFTAFDLLEPPPPVPAPVFGAPTASAQDDAQKQRRIGSAFLLLDLADLLSKYLAPVWAALQGGATPPDASFAALVTALSTNHVEGAGSATWKDALVSAWSEALVHPDATPSTSPDLSASELAAADLRALIKGALDAHPQQPDDPGNAQSTSVTTPKLDLSSTTLYRIRCVYQRPRCAPPHPDVVSDPSDSFAIAQFFDFDAPQRTVRIPLPIDTSVAGLRKFKPTIGFLLSNQLRAQIGRVTDLKKMLDGNLGDSNEDPSVTLGEICSFSLPIITICALIILMIFVILLNIVFFWMPFLKICLPVRLPSK